MALNSMKLFSPYVFVRVCVSVYASICLDYEKQVTLGNNQIPMIN